MGTPVHGSGYGVAVAKPNARSGRSSPETHGGKTKLATQVTEGLALCYDWLYNTLNKAEQRQILSAIEYYTTSLLTRCFIMEHQDGEDLH